MDVLVLLVDMHAGEWAARSKQAAAATATPSTPDATAPPLTFSSFCSQLTVFCNAFTLLNKANHLCVIGMDEERADFLWPPAPRSSTAVTAQIKQERTDDAAMTDTGAAAQRSSKNRKRGADGSTRGNNASASGSASSAAAASAIPSTSGSAATPAAAESDGLLSHLRSFAAQSAALTASRLQRIAECRKSRAAGGTAEEAGAQQQQSQPHTQPDVEDDEEESARGTKLAGALSLALCYLNRLHTSSHVNGVNIGSVKLRSRILICSLCPIDQSSQYVHIMNAIFSTQKQSIPVDSCVIGEKDSLFLQQASHLTKGVYARVDTKEQKALLQYLMFLYLSDPTSRSHLILPVQASVDFRATCFCHGQVVSLAVVCPVCLAIFCKSTPKCAVCSTRFAIAPAAAAAGRSTTPTQRPSTPPSATHAAPKSTQPTTPPTTATGASASST